LALVLGLGLALARRYISPKPHTRTAFDDALVLAVLAALAVGGVLLEAGRYLKEGTAASVGGYAFLGYPLSQAAEPLGWDWSLVYDWIWWTHAMVALGLIAYLPHSSLFHMFASPLTIALDGGDDGSVIDSPVPGRGEAKAWTA
jgi:nitrate reductase gamma subunit